MRSLYIGTTGMTAQQFNIDTIANNMANVTTNGYKKSRASFQDLLYQHHRSVGATSSDAGTIVPTGKYRGTGVQVVGTYRINEQGSLKQTDNDFDMAINGKGYFQVELPSGETAYTRDGAFHVSADGEIVTSEGYRVLPGITVPEDAIEIVVSKTGLAQAIIEGDPDPQEIGQFEISNFINQAGLKAIGDNLLLQTAASGDPILGNPGDQGFGSIAHRFLETSNVDIVTEVTGMIEAQRAYELNSRVLETTNEMMGTITNLR